MATYSTLVARGYCSIIKCVLLAQYQFLPFNYQNDQHEYLCVGSLS